jgi:asparagine synthase (glutamine-hydrolysing)
MVESLRHYDWQTPASAAESGAGIGHVIVNPPGVSAVPTLGRSGDLTVAFDGEIYGAFPLPPGGALPDRIARLLVERGPSALEAAHGCYACAAWNSARQELLLITDRFGTRPLYWARAGRSFLFASEIQALLSHPAISSEISEDGLAQFLAFGQYLGNTTLYHDIEVVPAASRLTFSAATGEVTVTTLAPITNSPEARTDADWLERIDALATAAVADACADAGTLGLSLSGGLDARTILAIAPTEDPIHCVSLGIPGSLDHRAAGRLAALAGQPHHPQMLAGDFLQRFEPLLEQMVRLTDGQYLDQGIVLTTLPAYRELGITTLMRGHAGELMHMSKAYAFSLDDEALRVTGKPQLIDWLWRHLTGYMIGSVDESFLRGHFGGRMRDMARAALERQVSAWDHVEPVPQRIWHLFVAERLRRETALSLQLFRNFVEVRVPFLEPGLVAALMSAPTSLKTHDTIQEFVLRRRRPSFLGVVNANTGARVGAGRTVARLSSLKLRAFAKLGVPGYQPYERLGSWLAHELQPWLRRVLVDGNVLEGRISSDEWKAVVDQHASRQRNHTFLLMAGAVLSLQLRSRHRAAAAGS